MVSIVFFTELLQIFDSFAIYIYPFDVFYRSFLVYEKKWNYSVAASYVHDSFFFEIHVFFDYVKNLPGKNYTSGH